MAIIPSEQKFHTLDKDTPTKDRGSKQAQALRKIYTMADIVETAGGGGGGIGGSITAGQIAFGAATSDEITGDDNFKITGDDLLIPSVIAHTGDTSTKFGFLNPSGADFQVLIQGQTVLRGTNTGSVQLQNSGFICLETLGFPGLGVKVTGQMNLASLNTAPSASDSTGTLGEIRWTSDYVYLCTAANTWVRAALATW
tara:strand:- start:1361 stop:1954 length:594 start_codon:yes stop_codon:yes gene_type:complete